MSALNPLLHFRLLSLVLAALSAQTVWAAPAKTAAQVVGSGRYEQDELPALVWQPKALVGVATVSGLIPEGVAKPGAQVLTLTMDGAEDALAAAKRAQAQAQRALVFEQAALAALDGELAAAKERVAAEAALAAERQTRWLEVERADALIASARQVENLSDTIQDDREELRQLEKMYKEARIDGSTQDLVVGRARRNLRKNELQLELSKRQSAYFASVEVVQKDQAFARAKTEADLRLAAESRRAAVEKNRQQEAVAKAELALKQLEKQVQQIEADRDGLKMVLPVEARLEWAVKAGDVVKPGQTLARLFAPTGGRVRIEVQPHVLSALPVGAAVRLQFVEIGLASSGRVVKVGRVGEPAGAKTLFPVWVAPQDPAFDALVGLKVEVAQ